MTGDDQFDGRPPQAFHDIEVLLTGHPENPIDTLVFERRDEKIRSLHVRSLLKAQNPLRVVGTITAIVNASTNTEPVSTGRSPAAG
jgi:hypothetical protein